MAAPTLPLRLFLVDEDPAFCLGLRVGLSQPGIITIVGEAATPAEALTQIAALTPARGESPALDLVVVDLGLGQDKSSAPESLGGLQLCQQLRETYPTLKIAVLAPQVAPALAAAVQAMGANGLALRTLSLEDLSLQLQAIALADTVTRPGRGNPLGQLQQSCLAQIATAIAAVEAEQRQTTDGWYQQVLQGRHRELRAARWLITHLLPPSSPTAAAPPPPASLTPSDPPPEPPPPLAPPLDPVTTPLLETLFQQLQTPLENRSGLPLEIDILRLEKRQELLYLLLRAFEDLLTELRQGEITPERWPTQVSQFLQDLWLAGLTQFFGRYYTPDATWTEGSLLEVLRQEQQRVTEECLDRIPGVEELVAHLLFQGTQTIEGVEYEADHPRALAQSQIYLEHLLIQVACGVIQPLLNCCPDVEALKVRLYERRLASSREIARFRNELSWRYRWQQWVSEPQAIFESRRQLFHFSPAGIQTRWIYAPRQEELASLAGIPYGVTLALEARDAIAPRIRATISLVGSGVVYLLTEVVGRGIGLIGRGIIKGIGNAWQDPRFRRP